MIRRRRSYVHVVHDVDGHKIDRWVKGKDDRGLTGGDVLALRAEAQCHPGELVTFDVHHVPLPWEPPLNMDPE